MNPFTAMLASPATRKMTSKSSKFEIIQAFFSLCIARDKMSIKIHNAESRFVIRPLHILVAGVYVCTFQTGN